MQPNSKSSSTTGSMQTPTKTTFRGFWRWLASSPSMSMTAIFLKWFSISFCCKSLIIHCISLTNTADYKALLLLFIRSEERALRHFSSFLPLTVITVFLTISIRPSSSYRPSSRIIRLGLVCSIFYESFPYGAVLYPVGFNLLHWQCWLYFCLSLGLSSSPLAVIPSSSIHFT